MQRAWDYLIVTAANDLQAEAYRLQIRARLDAGALAEFGEVLVIADTDGRRIGSGGSTLQCLLTVVNREPGTEAEEVLRRRRILIVHAGGDSRRLPAYSPCGKIFVPLPGKSASPVVHTLFDRLVSTFLAMPPSPEGQTVVASGDALILFDPSPLDLSKPGLTALGARATTEEASRHGVFCVDGEGTVRLYLQKPSVAEQLSSGAAGADGRSLLDVGVMSFSGEASAALLRAFCGTHKTALRPEVETAVLDYGLDLYREICCAMGSETTLARYIRSARESGSKWPDGTLSELFPALHAVPLHLQALEDCRFLHFGSTRQLISSGLSLVAEDTGAPPASTTLTLTTEVGPGGAITGCESWVEGCRVRAPLSLAGRNVVVGLDISEAVRLPEGACVDVSTGFDRQGERVWFVRCYGVDDTFKHPAEAGATFCGAPLARWMQAAGLCCADVWEEQTAAKDRTLWNARLFPAERERESFRRWLWMFDPDLATAEQKRAFLETERYSAAEIALLADQEDFHRVRQAAHVWKSN